MDSPCFTMPYLESLSTAELVLLAGQYDLDIPPDLERIFIIEELLELERNRDSKKKEKHNLASREFQEISPIPGHYNISFVEVLIRDPLWAFVIWEIKRYNRELYEKASDFDGYNLRIVPLMEGSFQADIAASFVVAVGVHDHAWYLGFPPDKGRHYIIELCAQQWDNNTVLAVSQPFTLPGGNTAIRNNIDIDSVYRNPLAQLSGVGSFSLIHDFEQIPRTFLQVS